MLTKLPLINVPLSRWGILQLNAMLSKSLGLIGCGVSYPGATGIDNLVWTFSFVSNTPLMASSIVWHKPFTSRLVRPDIQLDLVWAEICNLFRVQ